MTTPFAPIILADFIGMDESEIQKVVSAVVKSIRIELEHPWIPKEIPKIDIFADPVVVNVKGSAIRTRTVSNDTMLLNFDGETPVSYWTLDIQTAKAFPSAPEVLHTVLESLRQKEARFDEAEILEAEEISNSAKCVPDTINMAPVVGEFLASPGCRKMIW